MKYDYPIVESITSALPLCDEFIVNVGRCEDGTLELIQSIGMPKIKIVESVWDESLRQRRVDLFAADQYRAWPTVRAIGRSTSRPMKCFTKTICRSCGDPWQQHAGNPTVKGLLFRYLHFIADYWSTNPWFYHKAVRIIRNNGEMESCGDAVGFHFKATQQYLQSGPKEWLAYSGAGCFITAG